MIGKQREQSVAFSLELYQLSPQLVVAGREQLRLDAQLEHMRLLLVTTLGGGHLVAFATPSTPLVVLRVALALDQRVADHVLRELAEVLSACGRRSSMAVVRGRVVYLAFRLDAHFEALFDEVCAIRVVRPRPR